MQSLPKEDKGAFIMQNQHHDCWYSGNNVGGRLFLRWWPTSAMWAIPLHFLSATIVDVWIIPSFQYGVLSCTYACFMCHHEWWPTAMSHPFSFLDSSLGLAGGTHNQKNVIPIFRLALQKFAILGRFPYILCSSCYFSLFSSGWVLIAVWGSISVQGYLSSCRNMGNWCKLMLSCHLQWQVNKTGAFIFFTFHFHQFFFS